MNKTLVYFVVCLMTIVLACNNNSSLPKNITCLCNESDKAYSIEIVSSSPVLSEPFVNSGNIYKKNNGDFVGIMNGSFALQSGDGLLEYIKKSPFATLSKRKTNIYNNKGMLPFAVLCHGDNKFVLSASDNDSYTKYEIQNSFFHDSLRMEEIKLVLKNKDECKWFELDFISVNDERKEFSLDNKVSVSLLEWDTSFNQNFLVKKHTCKSGQALHYFAPSGQKVPVNYEGALDNYSVDFINCD